MYPCTCKRANHCTSVASPFPEPNLTSPFLSDTVYEFLHVCPHVEIISVANNATRQPPIQVPYNSSIERQPTSIHIPHRNHTAMAPTQLRTCALLMAGPTLRPSLWAHTLARTVATTQTFVFVSKSPNPRFTLPGAFPSTPSPRFARLPPSRPASTTTTSETAKAPRTPKTPKTATRTKTPAITWTYHYRRAKGLCYSCNKPALPNLAYCTRHVEQQSTLRHRSYLRSAASGQCGRYNCSEPRAEGFSVCKEHLQIQRERTKRLYEEQQAKGLCRDGKCPNKAEEPHTLCAKHREKRARLARERRLRARAGRGEGLEGEGAAEPPKKGRRRVHLVVEAEEGG